MSYSVHIILLWEKHFIEVKVNLKLTKFLTFLEPFDFKCISRKN